VLDSRLIIAALVTATLASSGCKKNVEADSQPPEAAPSADASAETAETDAPQAEEKPVVAAPEPPSLPPCEPLPENVKKLVTFKKLKVPGSYWLMLARPEGNMWLPEEYITDRQRHETTLELKNANDLKELVDYAGTNVRATIEILSKATTIDDSSRTWFYYHRLNATITAVCVPEDEG
jgi:hypothetical protein